MLKFVFTNIFIQLESNKCNCSILYFTLFRRKSTHFGVEQSSKGLWLSIVDMFGALKHFFGKYHIEECSDGKQHYLLTKILFSNRINSK